MLSTERLRGKLVTPLISGSGPTIYTVETAMRATSRKAEAVVREAAARSQFTLTR
jgi:homoserine kinase